MSISKKYKCNIILFFLIYDFFFKASKNNVHWLKYVYTSTSAFLLGFMFYFVHIFSLLDIHYANKICSKIIFTFLNYVGLFS